jgi:DNA-binding NarL/FixJ family response regulator
VSPHAAFVFQKLRTAKGLLRTLVTDRRHVAAAAEGRLRESLRVEPGMTTGRQIRVLSVDDHPLLSEGLATMINSQPDMRLVASASTGNEGILKHRELKPDITLMDLRLPDRSGIDVMVEIRAESPDARFILLTMFAGDVEIQRALKAGAQGYLLKSMPPDQMLATIREVCAGKRSVAPELASQLAEHVGDEPLSNREIEVLRYVSEGNRNREIAKKLFISEDTVKAHLKHIMEKLGASDRTEAMAIAARRGFIQL